MLTINNLSFSYQEESILKNLNLVLANGLVHGIVGLNGAGKTTLFNLIYGFLSPDSGDVQWNEKMLKRELIGYLPTENYFYHNITGAEYLALFNKGSQTYNEEIWAEILSLPLNELVDNYSTGMRKKLALLGLLKQDKELMILDEPFNGIDLETSRVLMLLLKKLKANGKTILISSHIIETLTETCDFIHHLEEGRFKNSFAQADIPQIKQELFQKLELKHLKLINQVL